MVHHMESFCSGIRLMFPSHSGLSFECCTKMVSVGVRVIKRRARSVGRTVARCISTESFDNERIVECHTVIHLALWSIAAE